MSIKLMSMVFDASGLKPTHKLVMLCLCDFAADDGTSIYPSVSLVAHRTALNPSTVRKTIHELRDKSNLNLIAIARMYTSKRPNVYRVNVDRLRVLCSNRVLPDSTQGATTGYPRVLPDSTDPSVDPSVDPPTNSADAEMRALNPRLQAIKLLEEEFSKLTSIPLPARETEKQKRAAAARWWSPLGELYSMTDKDEQRALGVMRAVIEKMQKDKLTIAAPQSILNNCIAHIAKQNKPRIRLTNVVPA